MPDQSFRLGAPGNNPVILAQSAIPFVLPSSGTFTGGTGALSGLTALPTTYSGGCFMYFPAGAGLPQGAGWYWTIMSSTTAGTVYNNVYSSGDPKLASPGNATAGTAITSGATSYTQTTGANITAQNYTLPGGALGPNGSLSIEHLFGVNNSANNKILSILALGQAAGVFTHTLTTMANVRGWFTAHNMNSQSRQSYLLSMGSYMASGTGTIATVAGTTATDQTVGFAMQLATATDFAIQAHHSIQIRYGA